MSPDTPSRAQFTTAETNLPIFVSYASPDRPHVERLIKVLEAAHLRCWVSYRDIGVGENYQAAISQALRSARVLIVILSRSANSSVEIPKELSLASRNRLAIMPLRVEAVQPADALAYELATHQWIDLFGNWETACDRLLSQLAVTLWASRAAPRSRQGLSLHRLPIAARASGIRAPVAWNSTASLPQTARANPKSDSLFIGFVQFAIVAFGFSSQLYSSLQEGGPSLLELLFWAFFLSACAGVVGALLRGFTAVSRENHQGTLSNPRSPVST